MRTRRLFVILVVVAWGIIMAHAWVTFPFSMGWVVAFLLLLILLGLGLWEFTKWVENE